MRIMDCPKCGLDISESYQDYDPSVGIMAATWVCDGCGEVVVDDSEQGEYDEPA